MTTPNWLQTVPHDNTSAERTSIGRQPSGAENLDRTRSGASGNEPATHLVGHPLHPGSFICRSKSPWLRLLVRVMALSLDRQIASGRHVESNCLLAARAESIASLAARRTLAQSWHILLDQTRRAPVPRSPRAPLCRARIIAAEDDVRAMMRALSIPLPIPARGVAMASRLLSDGTGPVYNRNCSIDPRTAVWDATAQLDPAAMLTQYA
jgi:hypothetical protein